MHPRIAIVDVLDLPPACRPVTGGDGKTYRGRAPTIDEIKRALERAETRRKRAEVSKVNRQRERRSEQQRRENNKQAWRR